MKWNQGLREPRAIINQEKASLAEACYNRLGHQLAVVQAFHMPEVLLMNR